MSAAGSKLRDIAVLADEGATVPVELPVRDLPRLLPELAADSGVARGELRFLRDRGAPAADVTLEADVTLVCQRCMQPLVMTVGSQARVYFPRGEAEADRLPAELETMLAPEGRLRLADIVAEDLLLALPLSPRHEDEAQCEQALQWRIRQDEQERGEDDEVRRPFAALAELMGRVPRRDEDESARPDEAPRTRR